MTYQDDILDKAILGILRLFEKGRNPVCLHWGIAILLPVIKGRNGWPSPVQRSRSDGFAAGLCWQHMAPGYWRVGFPSWPWSGWNVCLSEESEEYECGLRTQGPSNIEVFLEDTNQSLLPLNVLRNSFNPNPDLSSCIYLPVCTIQIKLQYDPKSKDSQPDFLPPGRKPTLGSAYWARST